MQRERTEATTLRAEESRIFNFAMTALEPEPGQKLPIETAFEMYQAWLTQNGLGATELSVSAFGRLFPKNFQRRAIWTKEGTKRAIMDVKLRAS